MREKLRPVIRNVQDFASAMGERRLPIYATSGCYYLFMSLVPIVMIFCCILPYTPFRQELILGYIDIYFAESLGEIIRRIVNAVYSSNAATLTVSIVLTLFSASASMKSLMNGMDAAYHCNKKNNFIVFTLRALLYMVLLVATLLIALVIMVFGGRILMLLRRYFASVGPLGFILSRSRYLLVMVILFLVFTVLYTLMPSEKVRVVDQIPGALFSSILWVVFSWGFTLYMGISDKYGAYGVIGTVMVTMMWGYYCLFFLLIGGFINSYLTDRRESRITYVAPEPVPMLSPDAMKSASSAEICEHEPVNDISERSDSESTVFESAGRDVDLPASESPAGKEKKKLPVPVIAGIGAAAAALFTALILFLRKRKKKAKLAKLAAAGPQRKFPFRKKS